MSDPGVPNLAAQHPVSGGDAERALSERVNWNLIQHLAEKPHKHLNIVEGERYGLMVDGVFDTGCGGVGEVMQEARTVQHLCDMAGVPEGWGYTAHIDARVFLLISDLLAARERLARIASWHSLETGPGGMVGLYCIECGTAHPCETRRMADGTHEDLAVQGADVVDPGTRARVEYDEATQELAAELADERTLHQETIRERDQLRAEVARVRADALRSFAAEMRTLAEQAPEGEPARWPWSAYALAAVKAKERASAPAERVQDAPTDTAGTPMSDTPPYSEATRQIVAEALKDRCSWCRATPTRCPGHDIDAPALLDVLAAAGLLLPEGAETNVEYTVRFISQAGSHVVGADRQQQAHALASHHSRLPGCRGEVLRLTKHVVEEVEASYPGRSAVLPDPEPGE